MRASMLLAATIAAAACGSNTDGSAAKGTKVAGKAAKDPKTAEGAGAAVCDVAHGKALEREMAAMCGPEPRSVGAGVPRSPWAKESNLVPPGSRLRVDAEGWTFDGMKVGGPGELAAHIEREAEVARRINRSPAPWSLEIEGSVSRADVAKVLAALVDAKKGNGNLLLSVDAGEMPQPRDGAALAKLHGEIVAAGGDSDPSVRASALAKTITESLPKCEGLEKAFRAVATAPPDKRCPLLARGISEGLVRCNCPEEDQVLTLIYAVTVGTEVPTELASLTPVTLKPDVAPTPGATWSEIVAAMEPAELQTLWVE